MKPQMFAYLMVAVLGASCGERAGDLDDDIELSGTPVALDEHLLLLSPGSQLGFLLEATSAEPRARAKRVSLPYGALRAVPRRDHDEALVICAGRRDSASMRAVPATLAVVGSDGARRDYELGATPFDQLVQSEDGRYAVLFRGPDVQGRTLQNVNELVVVDLDVEPDAPGAVTSKTPEGLGRAFSHAVISPELSIAGETRRLLVLLSAAEITLFDLTHLERRGTIVELGGDDGRMPQPRQVLFGEREPTLYVRGDNADDVFVFRLEARSGDAGLNDFRPTINPLGAGRLPRDIELFGSGDAQQVLVVSEPNEARLIDPRSGKTTTIQLPAQASEIRVFEGASPRDSQSRTRALLYQPGSSTVMFLDLDGMRDRPERNVETLTLSAELKSVIEVERASSLIVTHPQGVTLLDLEQRTATPIAANAPLEGALYDPETDRLWVATQSQSWVGSLHLTSGETGELRLDADVLHLAPFFAFGRLVVVHPSDIGHVTFVDTAEPTRERARSIEGFLLAGVLDRGEP